MGGREKNVGIQGMLLSIIFFFKQKTAYRIRLSLVGSEMCIGDGAIIMCPNYTDGV